MSRNLTERNSACVCESIECDSNTSKDIVNSIAMQTRAAFTVHKLYSVIVFLLTLTFFPSIVSSLSFPPGFYSPNNVPRRNFFWLFVLFHFIFTYSVCSCCRLPILEFLSTSREVMATDDDGHGYHWICKATGNKPQSGQMLTHYRWNFFYSSFCSETDSHNSHIVIEKNDIMIMLF